MSLLSEKLCRFWFACTAVLFAGTAILFAGTAILFAGTASGGPSGGGVTDPDLIFLRNN